MVNGRSWVPLAPEAVAIALPKHGPPRNFRRRRQISPPRKGMLVPVRGRLSTAIAAKGRAARRLPDSLEPSEGA